MIVLIIILSILLGIPLLIFLLLLFPVSFDACYNSEGVYLTIKYLFIKKEILKPTQGEESVEEIVEEEALEQENKIISLVKNKGLMNLLSIFKELIKLAFGTLKKIVRKIKIKYMGIDINVSSDNAADTAIRYGQACTVVYPFVSAVTSLTKCRKYDAKLGLDYKRESDIIDVRVKGSIVPIFVVIHGLGLLKDALPYINKLRA